MGPVAILLPVVLPNFYRYRCKFRTLLQLVNQWLNFTYARTANAFRYGRQNKNSGDKKNRTHDFRTINNSRCARYLPTRPLGRPGALYTKYSFYE